jgi:hypothetical protein
MAFCPTCTQHSPPAARAPLAQGPYGASRRERGECYPQASPPFPVACCARPPPRTCVICHPFACSRARITPTMHGFVVQNPVTTSTLSAGAAPYRRLPPAAGGAAAASACSFSSSPSMRWRICGCPRRVLAKNLARVARRSRCRAGGARRAGGRGRVERGSGWAGGAWRGRRGAPKRVYCPKDDRPPPPPPPPLASLASRSALRRSASCSRCGGRRAREAGRKRVRGYAAGRRAGELGLEQTRHGGSNGICG